MNRPFTQIEMQYLIGKFGSYQNVVRMLGPQKKPITLQDVLAPLKHLPFVKRKPPRQVNQKQDRVVLVLQETVDL